MCGNGELTVEESDTTDGAEQMSNRLREIEALGQSIWIDNISRQLLEEGIMARLIEEDGISGVTSNPTIFEKATGHSDRYDDAFREVIGDTGDPQEIFERLAYLDIREAADLLMPTFEKTHGKDGYASFEVPASVAFDARKTIAAARRYKREIDRPNVLIKVPGTGEGVEAFEELTALGVNVNVTLLFAVERYEAIAEAFIKGLERRVENGGTIDKVGLGGELLRLARGHEGRQGCREDGARRAQGKAAVANARIAYESFQRIFSGPRWEALAAKGARVERPLLASSSTKNPNYPDTLYVDELIGPDTVNTMPEATIDAARDHATPARTVDQAHKLIEQVTAAGVDFDKIALEELVDEGVKSFSDSYESLLDTIRDKASALVHAS
jgi:transaldolase